MSTTQISLDIDLGQSIDEIREHIISAAAQQMLMQTTIYNDDPHFTKLAQSLRDDISRAIKAEVEKVVAPAVTVALEEGVQPTDSYGTPRGEKLPLRSVIVAEAEKALNKKVEIRDNYGRSESVIQQVIRDEVQKAMAADLKEIIAEERKKVTAAVHTEAAQLITQAVERSVARVG
jgi:hypothetical protein